MRLFFLYTYYCGILFGIFFYILYNYYIIYIIII